MSRKKKTSSAPKEPAFAPSAIYYGDQLAGQTYKDPQGQIVTKYFTSPEEETRKKEANTRINQILPTLGMEAPELAGQYDQMKNDYIGQQTDSFTREYDKTLKNLREDVSSRFGTLKATPYFDKLTELEKDVRAPALVDIQRTGSMYRTDLANQDQARKLRELSALGYTMGADQNTFLQGIQSPLQGSQLMNQFNQNQYMYRMQDYNNQLAQKQSNPLFGFLRGVA